jgi:hypothetical protein
MRIPSRFRLSLNVLAVVVALVVLKLAVHRSGFEFVGITSLIPSVVAGGIFIIGFLLSSILADYKQAELMPAEFRAAIEAIHDDAVEFTRKTHGFDLGRLRRALVAIIAALESGLGAKKTYDELKIAIERVSQLSPFFAELEELGMSQNELVRLRGEQDILRKSLFRVYYLQRIEFVPSAHVLVQTIVFANVFFLLFLRSDDIVDSAMIFGFVSYIFIYALFLIETLEQPFRKGRHTLDDVSIFLLRDLAEKLSAPPA